MNLDIPNIGSVTHKTLPNVLKDGRWRLETPRAFAHHRLYWVTHGQGHAVHSGRRQGFNAAALLFFPAGCVHAVALAAKPAAQGTRICLPAGLVAGLPGAPLVLRIDSAREQAEIAGLIERILDERRQMAPGAELAIGATLQLLGVWMMRRQAARMAARPDRPDAASRLAAAYAELVERRFRRAPSVSDLAGELGVTPTHLSRVCRTVYGCSAQRFLQRRILAEARQALTEGRAPIREVAAELGFSSPAYFSRFIARETGKPPVALRAEARAA